MDYVQYPEILEDIAKAVDDLVRNLAVWNRFRVVLDKWVAKEHAAFAKYMERRHERIAYATDLIAGKVNKYGCLSMFRHKNIEKGFIPGGYGTLEPRPLPPGVTEIEMPPCGMKWSSCPEVPKSEGYYPPHLAEPSTLWPLPLDRDRWYSIQDEYVALAGVHLYVYGVGRRIADDFLPQAPTVEKVTRGHEWERRLFEAFLEDVKDDLRTAIPGYDQPAKTEPPPVPQAVTPAATDAHDEQGHAATQVTPSLRPSVEKAYRQYLFAAERLGPDVTDRDAYDWLEKHPDGDDELPSFDTWSKYVRTARKAHGQPKNQPRNGREPGRSIVRDTDIDGQDTSEAD